MLIYLTTVSGILKPFAFILGLILNGIYELMSLVGVRNLAICIILFTIVTRMLMLPLTIKQQKFTKLSSLMNPELQAIQEKYKNKKDEASQRRFQEETQEVYRKYGASPLGGCLPLLITLPIMFALYRVIYKMPAYINDVYALYDNIVVLFKGTVGSESAAMNIISNFTNGFGITNASRLVSTIGKYSFETEDFKKACIDVFAYFNASNWEAFMGGKLIESESWKALLTATGQTADTWVSYLKTALGDNYLSALSTMSINDLGTSLGIANLSESVNLSELAGSIYWNTFALGDSLKTVIAPSAAESVAEIINVNNFIGGLNILDTPAMKIFPGIFIPIFAAGTQLLQSVLMQANQKNTNSRKNQEENPMAQSMKSMMYVMPVVSGVICYSLPVGVGLYWIMGTVVQIVQQLLINRYLDNKPVDEIVQEAVKKNEKMLEKYGVKQQGDGTVSYLARTSTKSLSEISKIKTEKNQDPGSDHNADNSSATGSKGGSSSGSGKSISDIANIMKNRGQ